MDVPRDTHNAEHGDKSALHHTLVQKCQSFQDSAPLPLVSSGDPSCIAGRGLKPVNLVQIRNNDQTTVSHYRRLFQGSGITRKLPPRQSNPENINSALGRQDSLGNIQCWVLTQHSRYPREFNDWEVVMLVLRRRVGEEIIINENIRIVVAQTTEGSCSLAIEAPDSYRIRRAELPPFQESMVRRTASAWQVQQ